MNFRRLELCFFDVESENWRRGGNNVANRSRPAPPSKNPTPPKRRPRPLDQFAQNNQAAESTPLKAQKLVRGCPNISQRDNQGPSAWHFGAWPFGGQSGHQWDNFDFAPCLGMMFYAGKQLRHEKWVSGRVIDRTDRFWQVLGLGGSLRTATTSPSDCHPFGRWCGKGMEFANAHTYGVSHSPAAHTKDTRPH